MHPGCPYIRGVAIRKAGGLTQLASALLEMCIYHQGSSIRRPGILGHLLNSGFALLPIYTLYTVGMLAAVCHYPPRPASEISLSVYMRVGMNRALQDVGVASSGTYIYIYQVALKKRPEICVNITARILCGDKFSFVHL